MVLVFAIVSFITLLAAWQRKARAARSTRAGAHDRSVLRFLPSIPRTLLLPIPYSLSYSPVTDRQVVRSALSRRRPPIS